MAGGIPVDVQFFLTLAHLVQWSPLRQVRERRDPAGGD